jgi:3-carboxy-cis,cis-muconate cycloisomerase
MTPRISLDPGFSTEAMSAVYSPDATVGAILRFEEALASSLADAGLAPPSEAAKVAQACQAGVDDAGAILATTWETGTPIIALRIAIEASIADEAASRWFHFGATTQDAVDTGQMIQADAALGLLETALIEVARKLRDLTVTYRDQPHMGRTFLRDARPITFGFRTAGWLQAVISHITRVRGTRGELVIQLGGPVGTADDYGAASSEVISGVAGRLGLGAPNISWATDRTLVRALAQTVGGIAATMAKIGGDLALLASSPIGEISVRPGGSSSLPGKQNPLDPVRAVAAARACDGAVAMLGSGTSHEMDRGVGGWQVEWVALPLALQTSAAAVEAIHDALTSLKVDTEVMSMNAKGASPDTTGIDAVIAVYDEIIIT